MSTRSALAGVEGLRSLRHRNFRLFWTGQLVSLVGTWMQTVAQGWLVLILTNNPFMLGVVAAAQFAPVLVLGLFGGIVADHLPKRRTLMVTQATAALLALVLAILTATHTVQVWEIVVLAFLLGCTSAIDMPTRQSFVIEMVGREDVPNAVALSSSVFNGARVVGPAIAGLTIGAFDISVAFFINAASFAAVLVGLAMMRESELVAGARPSMPRSVRAVRNDLAEGLGYVRRTRVALLAVLVVGMVSLAGMNFQVVVPALSKNVLGTGAEGYGFLMAASGIGSLTAALGMAFLGRPGLRVLVGGASLLGVIEVALAALLLALVGPGLVGAAGVGANLVQPAPGWLFGLALVAMFGVGMGGIAMAMTANTTIQLVVPDVLRGRVMAVYTTVFVGTTPIGGLLFGWIASWAGPVAAFGIGGAVSLAVGIAAWASLRRWSAAQLGGTTVASLSSANTGSSPSR